MAHTLHKPIRAIFAVAAMLAFAGCSSSETDSQTASLAAENLEKSRAFLEENAKKPDVEVMNNGIQYKIITSNPEGRVPKLIDSVRVHLRMSKINGDVISDSTATGEPATIYIKHAIAGWRKTLTTMQVGSKWIVYLPPHMGFSSRGNKKYNIDPNETLICEIELLDIVW